MTYEELKKEILSSPVTKKEYEALEPEYQLLLSVLRCREEQRLSQQDLADITGINRADISRIEHGNANPSLKTIKRLAEAMGKRLHISFSRQ